jgi:4-methylaminobutanoate oxidase (formaldehyde-forming)
VIGITRGQGRVTGVVTDRGRIAAEYVVNCAGLWGREVGRMVGVNVPLQAREHFYVVTEANPAIPKNLPVLRVPDECAYYKEDAGKLLFGFFEPVAKPWGIDRIPEDAEFLTLPDDWEHIAPELEKALARVPLLGQTGIHTFFNGPESFTPDNRYLLGEAPELRNFCVAAGFNSIGIQSAGGARQAAVRMDGRRRAAVRSRRRRHPSHVPLPGQQDVPRHPCLGNVGVTLRRSLPLSALRDSARGIRHTPLHERLAARGVCFGEAAGWERPFWFLPPAARARGEAPEYRYSWKRQNWFPHAAEEHRAVRTGAGLFDLTPTLRGFPIVYILPPHVGMDASDPCIWSTPGLEPASLHCLPI